MDFKLEAQTGQRGTANDIQPLKAAADQRDAAAAYQAAMQSYNPDRHKQEPDYHRYLITALKGGDPHAEQYISELREALKKDKYCLERWRLLEVKRHCPGIIEDDLAVQIVTDRISELINQSHCRHSIIMSIIKEDLYDIVENKESKTEIAFLFFLQYEHEIREASSGAAPSPQEITAQEIQELHAEYAPFLEFISSGYQPILWHRQALSDNNTIAVLNLLRHLSHNPIFQVLFQSLPSFRKRTEVYFNVLEGGINKQNVSEFWTYFSQFPDQLTPAIAEKIYTLKDGQPIPNCRQMVNVIFEKCQELRTKGRGTHLLDTLLIKIFLPLEPTIFSDMQGQGQDLKKHLNLLGREGRRDAQKFIFQTLRNAEVEQESSTYYQRGLNYLKTQLSPSTCINSFLMCLFVQPIKFPQKGAYAAYFLLQLDNWGQYRDSIFYSAKELKEICRRFDELKRIPMKGNIETLWEAMPKAVALLLAMFLFRSAREGNQDAQNKLKKIYDKINISAMPELAEPARDYFDQFPALSDPIAQSQLCLQYKDRFQKIVNQWKEALPENRWEPDQFLAFLKIAAAHQIPGAITAWADFLCASIQNVSQILTNQEILNDLQNAANNGHPKAAYMYAMALELLRKTIPSIAMETIIKYAGERLADLLIKVYEVKNIPDDWVSHLKTAADNKNVSASYAYGMTLREAESESRSYLEILKFKTLITSDNWRPYLVYAAEQGHPDAINTFGELGVVVSPASHGTIN